MLTSCVPWTEEIFPEEQELPQLQARQHYDQVPDLLPNPLTQPSTSDLPHQPGQGWGQGGQQQGRGVVGPITGQVGSGVQYCYEVPLYLQCQWF